MANFDYVKNLGYKPRILVVDDEQEVRDEYRKSLEGAGFVVFDSDLASKIEDVLKEESIDVVLCDTNLVDEMGDKVCRKFYEDGVIGDNILLLGMSGDPNNFVFWRGLAHIAGFFEKGKFNDVGKDIMSHYYNFVNYSTWRQRMPKAG